MAVGLVIVREIVIQVVAVAYSQNCYSLALPKSHECRMVDSILLYSINTVACLNGVTRSTLKSFNLRHLLYNFYAYY